MLVGMSPRVGDTVAVTMLCFVTWPAQRCWLVTGQGHHSQGEHASPKIDGSFGK